MKASPAYAELACASNFSFLRGASHAYELVPRAWELGQNGIGIADRNTVAGVVRAHTALKMLRDSLAKEGTACNFKLAVGARLAFSDGTPDIIAYPENRAGWGRLCRLLTSGNLRARKGECRLGLDDLTSHCGDLLLIVMPDDLAKLRPVLMALAEAAPGAVWLGATMLRQGNDHRRLAMLQAIAQTVRVPLLATNDVLYHAPDRRPLQDIITCIREGLRIETAGRRLEVNAERHLKSPAEMLRLFRYAPEAVAEIQHVLARIDFSLDELKYEYPEEPVPPGKTPQTYLEELAWRRAELRYPDGIPERIVTLLRQELSLIAELNYANYFLTIHDIVDFAKNRGILCQGRGSAANSVVCFLLGITNVDPMDIDVLFARFVSKERQEPPDIDVDFEHERREEVIQYIYDRYGRHRAGIAATVIHYRPRSAIREVGKVLGLTEDITSALASTVWGSWGDSLPDGQVRQAGSDPANPEIARAVDFANQLIEFPRHLSQHVGGFVLTRDRLDETVPIGNAAMPERTFIEWDRDDIDELGLLKVDVLALGMLTCIKKAFDLLKQHKGLNLDLTSTERNDPVVYDMLCKGDSIGVFQVESRAQINMLPRLRPREYYDLVIQVAIVRPGPIQGDMVHPYLRRRKDPDEVDYPSPGPGYPKDELKDVLGRTLGVPLFQEQAMKLAIVAAEFTSEQANQLRRAMATFRNAGTIHEFEHKLIEGMVRRGYDRDFAERCFAQIKGFGTYGFPESHAAAFAHLVYVSSWIKCHHPEVFACALLNSQPMGFYAPAQIVRDAREHGVELRMVDVNASHWDNTLEQQEDGSFALRLGFRQIDGFHREWAERIVAARSHGYADMEILARRTRLTRACLQKLADADACRSMGLDRREALWAVRRLPDDAPLPLFAAADAAELGSEPEISLPAMPLAEQVITDYQTIRLSLKAHPLVFLRDRYRREGIASCGETAARTDGAWIKTAGVVLVRQRPGEGTVIFITLEDETGVTNVVVWSSMFEKFRREVMSARLLEVRGRVQKSEEGIVHVVAQRLIDRSADLTTLTEMAETNPRLPHDNAPSGYVASRARHPRNVRVIPKSRDFH
ncbi:error-prone DNA polymerase [Rhodoligotrophos ferricapiens]|uniref:error-prone DNA polymerase n=1 Tax=Rhodoligotrophos ferricapiens TaxID=3069264 RepID=UPI00315DD53E